MPETLCEMKQRMTKEKETMNEKKENEGKKLFELLFPLFRDSNPTISTWFLFKLQKML